MTRRDLIQKVIIGGTMFYILPPVLSSCSKEEDTNGTGTDKKKLTLDMTLPAYSALKNTGEFVIVQEIIVANTAGGYIALDSTCTHEGCTISYDSASNNLPCPCHGSVFATSGSVVNGPATLALKSYSVSKSGDILTINLE
jgi:cytochrome b6-f complex iron-sulfur subunit